MVRRKYEEETIRLGKDEAKIKSEKRIIRRKGLKEKEDWQNERISRKVRDQWIRFNFNLMNKRLIIIIIQIYIF